MKPTEIIKAKLKEIEDIRKKEKMIAKKSYYEIEGKPVSKKEFDKRDVSSLFFKDEGIMLNPKLGKLKSFLSGMQTAIESELEFLEELKRYKFKCGFMERELCEVFEDNESISERITELKNALKLIEVGK